MTGKLTLDDLARGLLDFSGSYFALDVFAQDIAELQNGSTTPEADLKPLPDGAWAFERRGKQFELRVFREFGVARVTLADTKRESRPSSSLTGAAVGATIGALANPGGRGSGAAIGLLVGLLVGAAIGSATPDAPRRVFALKFDPDSREWRAYDGGLVRWLKQQLGPREVVRDLPPAAELA